MITFKRNDGETFTVVGATKDELMELLVRKTRKEGHKLSFNDVAVDPEMISPNDFAPYWGSFDRAAEIAWGECEAEFETENSKQPEQIESTKQPDQSADPEKPVHRRRVGYRSALNAMKEFYRKNGRFPSLAECKDENNDLPSYGTFYRYFGSRKTWDRLKDKWEIEEMTESNEVCLSEQEDSTEDKTGSGCNAYDEDNDGAENAENYDEDDGEDDEVGCEEDYEEDNDGADDYDEDDEDTEDTEDTEDPATDEAMFTFELATQSLDISITLPISENVNLRITAH